MSGTRDLSGFGANVKPDRRIALAPPPAQPAETAVGTIERNETKAAEAVVDLRGSDAELPVEQPSSTKKSRPKSAAAAGTSLVELTKITATVPPGLLERVRQRAERDEVWASDVARDALMAHGADLGDPPSGRRTRTRKTGNYVTMSLILEPQELEVLEVAAAGGRNRSWVLREALSRYLSSDGPN